MVVLSHFSYGKKFKNIFNCYSLSPPGKETVLLGVMGKGGGNACPSISLNSNDILRVIGIQSFQPSKEMCYDKNIHYISLPLFCINQTKVTA